MLGRNKPEQVQKPTFSNPPPNNHLSHFPVSNRWPPSPHFPSVTPPHIIIISPHFHSHPPNHINTTYLNCNSSSQIPPLFFFLCYFLIIPYLYKPPYLRASPFWFWFWFSRPKKNLKKPIIPDILAQKVGEWGGFLWVAAKKWSCCECECDNTRELHTPAESGQGWYVACPPKNGQVVPFGIWDLGFGCGGVLAPEG